MRSTMEDKTKAKTIRKTKKAAFTKQLTKIRDLQSQGQIDRASDRRNELETICDELTASHKAYVELLDTEELLGKTTVYLNEVEATYLDFITKVGNWVALAKQTTKAEATAVNQPKPKLQQPHDQKEQDVREEMDWTLEAIQLDKERELPNEDFELQCLEMKLAHERKKQEIAAVEGQ